MQGLRECLLLVVILVAMANAQSTCTRGSAANIALGRKAVQSSNYNSKKYIASRAVDGKWSQNFGDDYCTHTGQEDYPWLYVDLGSVKSIGTIVLTNRFDCCGSRLKNIEIRIGNYLSKTGGTGSNNANRLLPGVSSSALPTKGRRAYFANGMSGRYVYIRLNYKRAILTLCELEVTEYCPKPCMNLALGQPTSQSTTGWQGYSDQGVDGDRESVYNARSCTHTVSETNPWWRVDLGMQRRVGVVRVTNRGDCCTTRLNGFEVRIGDDWQSGYAVCNSGDNEKTVPGGETMEFWCGNVLKDKAVSQYVWIVIPGSRKILTLCEVEVYETCTDTCNNVALKKPAFQKDLGWGGTPSRAVDGNTNGNYGGKSCSHTLNNGVPNWWYVDLGMEYKVNSIGIANRKDCCYPSYKNIQITVGNELSNYGRYNPTCRWPKNQRSTGVTYYPCSNNRGRYASVIMWDKSPLVLCEVIVCGSPLPNSAISKAAWMSSTNTGSSAYFAIDGNPSTNAKYCAVTKKDAQPYITVDLGKVQQITSVQLTFANIASMRNMIKQKGYVYVSSDPAIKNQAACSNLTSYNVKSSTVNLVCNNGAGIQGRYVEFIIAAPPSPLQLSICEFEIYTARPVQCKRGGYQGARCNSACPAGTGGVSCTKCPSASYGSLQLTDAKMCMQPSGGTQFPTVGSQLIWTDKCTDLSTTFAATGNGALQHVTSGMCIIAANLGSAVPIPGTSLVLDNRCTDDDAVFKFNPITKQYILDKYWTLCIGPFAKGTPKVGTAVTLQECKPQLGIFTKWGMLSSGVSKWHTVINIQNDDSRFYYNSALWTSTTPAYFGSESSPTNAFLSTYNSIKVNSIRITLGKTVKTFDLPDDMRGKYTLKQLVTLGEYTFQDPPFQGSSNMFSVMYSGTARATYYCGDYGFSQRLFSGVQNNLQCQGIARIGVTTSVKTTYGPIMTYNGKCLATTSKSPKAGETVKTQDCSPTDGRNYFYLTTDNILTHYSGLCVTSSSGYRNGGYLRIASCKSPTKFVYNQGTRTLATWKATSTAAQFCVLPQSTNPGNNVNVRVYSITSTSCKNTQQSYLYWTYPTTSAPTPCQRNKPLSAEGIGLSTGCLTSRYLSSGNIQGESSDNPNKFFSSSKVEVFGVPFCANNAACNRFLGTCDCAAGWYGMTCTLPCPTGQFGLKCAGTCNCKNGATCDVVTGKCQCAPGFTGTDCSLGCPANTFGVGCSPCNCPSASSKGCNPKTGACSCLAGYAGLNCNYQCNDPNGLSIYLNKYGINCKSRCTCGVNAVCNGFTGACTCNPGWQGATCKRSCASGTYGAACGSKCACLNGAACNPVDGTCTCKSGYFGLTCASKCTGTQCGSGCSSTCTCVNGVCNAQTCGCVSCNIGYTGKLCDKRCSAGKWGLNCASSCTCKNGALCSAVDGTCTCTAGWMGSDCGTKCATDKFGPNCLLPCNCGHGTCNPINGACDCDPGYAGTSCNVLCKDGSFGTNCSQSCACNLNFVDKSAGRVCNAVTGVCNCLSPYVGACDTVCKDPFQWGNPCGSQGTCNCVKANAVGCNQQHGTCDCKPGYMGADCGTVCPTGRWGQGCNQYCLCHSHGSTCDAVTGNCKCNPGWTGHTCSFACPNGTFGTGCSSACSCVQGACDVVSGACTCNPGFMGTNCGQACPTGKYGLLCAATCNCGNGTCDGITGACTCKDGFTGTSCDQQCAPGKYGTGCALNCPNCQNPLGHATGSCLPADGTCVCQAGYRGALCSDTCSKGWYGAGCAMACNCSGSPCDTVTGKCSCNAGRMGPTCNMTCPTGKYGVACGSICACFNGATCDAVYGTCTCAPGYYGAACSEACPANHWGANCNQVCGCSQTGKCNPQDGSCVCELGYTGTTCASVLSCPTGKYGASCKLDCQCKNGASCSSVNGSCTCADGYTGVFCEQGCPANTYGKNCAKDCSCINGDCASTNGSCDCFNGWMGGTCAAQCLEGLWGPNCMTKCNCSSAEIVCSRFNGACQNVQSEETSAPNSASNTVAIVVPIVVVLVLIGVVVVLVIVRSTKKIEKKMPAGMYTADEQDISYAPSEGGSATGHGISNPTYADPHAGLVNE